MNAATNKPTGTTLLTLVPAAAADMATANIEVDGFSRRLQQAKDRQRVFTHFLYRSATEALRRGGTTNRN